MALLERPRIGNFISFCSKRVHFKLRVNHIKYAVLWNMRVHRFWVILLLVCSLLREALLNSHYILALLLMLFPVIRNNSIYEFKKLILGEKNCSICAYKNQILFDCQVSWVVGALKKETPQPRIFTRGVCIFPLEWHFLTYCLYHIVTLSQKCMIILVSLNVTCLCSAPQIQTVTLIPGDGIGPEISTAVMKIFEAAKVSSGGAGKKKLSTSRIIY